MGVDPKDLSFSTHCCTVSYLNHFLPPVISGIINQNDIYVITIGFPAGILIMINSNQYKIVNLQFY